MRGVEWFYRKKLHVLRIKTMSSHIKKISIDDLVAGMYVGDVFNREDVLLLSADSVIKNNDQIYALRRQGVMSLYINTGKGRDVVKKIPDSEDKAVSDVREVEYYMELDKARDIHLHTIETAKDVFDSIRKGRSFSMSKIEEAAQNIVESILRNSDALISLCQIRGYDEYTYTHSVNVSVLTTSLASSLGYNQDQLLEIGVGGMLHDIGKMRVPESILNKPGKYTDWEFDMMKKHPEYGLDIVKEKKSISDFSRQMIILHHERYNGKGYPKNLKGNEIAEIGLMGAVADVYDALTSNRVYRAAWTPQKALAVIFKGCDAEYSRDIVERFTKQIGIYPVGSFVRLASGEMGIVTRVDKGHILLPEILILFDKNGKRLAKPLEYDLLKKKKEGGSNEFSIQISLNPKAYGINISEYIDEKSF
jgi:putative nucleotidyltransferase with HDIG domain